MSVSRWVGYWGDTKTMTGQDQVMVKTVIHLTCYIQVKGKGVFPKHLYLFLHIEGRGKGGLPKEENIYIRVHTI